jgi:hypothetical protein
MIRSLALGCALLIGCGGTVATQNGSGSASKGDPSGNAVGFYTLICDGGSGVRLAASVSGGGNASEGQKVLSGNGWEFLIVDGTCHAWVLQTEYDPVRELQLSRNQERNLSLALDLADWSKLPTQTYGVCNDGPNITYRFDRTRFSAPGCGAEGPIKALNVALDAQIAQLSATATPLSGDLRYQVFQNDDSLAQDHRAPVPWPLAVPLETISIARDDLSHFMSGQTQVATGDDAAKLRAIRTTRANGTVGDGRVLESTPVVGSDGIPTALYVRDATPFDGADGLITGDVF